MLLISLIFIATPALGKEMPGAKDLLEQQVVELDRQIARRMLRRPDTPSEKMPRLDMEIDLRIVARWFFAQGAAQKEANETQVVGRLRGLLALDAVAGVEDTLNRQREKLTLGQVDGMSRLHELTFKLADAKNAASLDDVSRQLGTAALLIAGPGAADPRTLPPMRPKLPPARERQVTQATEHVDVAEIADRLPGLNLSAPLRQQLTLLTAAATKAKEKDRDTTATTLATAFELAAALNNNVAVAPDARVRMEAQLAEGIALFLDPRTRTAGQTHIADLHEYRKIVERIGRLTLTPDETLKYAPIFAWAQREAEGVRALQALERFVQSRERARQRQKFPPSPIQNLRRSIEDLEKQHAAAEAGFNAAFDALIKTTGGAGAEGMDTRAAEMSQALDLLEKLDQAPATLDALSSLKPKPFGGLERRIVTAAVAVTSNSPQKAEGLKFLNDLNELAKLTSSLNSIPTDDFTAGVDEKYAGGRLSLLETKWKALATDVASAAAAGGELDAAKVARLTTARSIYDALRQAAAVEGAISTSRTLYRWIDWRMPAEDLEIVFVPYQQALAAAVAAYTADAPKPLEEWSKIEKRYRPLVNIVTRSRALQREAHALPDGLAGAAASLLTPCDNALFAQERFLAFAVAVCRSRLATGDEPAASEVMELLLKRMNNE